jgi:hypothetical protein
MSKMAQFLEDANKLIQVSSSEDQKTMTMTAHIKLLEVHSRALAAHCECLAMNAENCCAAIMDCTPPYKEEQFAKVMQKWGLINEKGEPLI